MTPISIPAPTTFLAQLAIAAARALALSMIVGIGLSAFRVRSTSPRLFTWTALLYAALAMPLLQQMLPPLPIPAPEFLERELTNARRMFTGPVEKKLPLLAAERRKNPAHGASRGKDVDVVQPQRGERRMFTEQKAVSADVPTLSFFWTRELIRWSAIAAAIYLAVALILLARFIVGLAFGRRLLRASQRINDPRITRPLAARAAAWGLASIPHAAESELISVPLTMGVFCPAILLPAVWREWDDAQLNAVVAHEVSHVARRDALTQHLSLLHRALFWFSPLAWWLDRHLADLGEQASDEAALSCGADRKQYARILLGFFEALHTAPGRVWWQGVSMAKAGQAEHRVERILTWKGSVAMSLKKSIAAMIIALAVPVVYLAASAHPAQHVSLPGVQPAQDQTPQPPPASAAAPSPGSETTPPPELGPASGVTGGVADGAVGGPVSSGPTRPPAPPAPAPGVGTTVRARVAPVAPVGPSAPVAVIAPIAPVAEIGQSESVSSSSGRGFSYHYGYDDEQRFVIVSGKTDSLTMSGSTEDARHVEKLRKQIPGDFIWFQRDEKSYVIRDQASVDRAKKLWEPQEELGKKQEALGKQQEALGKQQAELGAKMQQIRVNVPDLNADLEKLKAELKQLGSSGATVEQVGHIQSEIGELQSKIGNVQSHAGDQQGKLGEEMGALGEKQGKLGQQQGELGRQQGELAEHATRQMKQLLDEAITKGLAQPEI
jgi:beta-lactamase regulating signal transducer with metallopeptidase domain